jgi:AraC family transcriptional activator of pobA
MEQKTYSFFHCRQSGPSYQKEKDRKYFRIILTGMDANETADIYFIQPYSDFPDELYNKKGTLIAFQFDFLQVNTEHKDVLFNIPVLVHEYRYYHISLDKKNAEYLEILFKCIVAESRRNDIRSSKILVSFINIVCMHCTRLLKKNAAIKGKHHYTSLLIVSRFKQLVYKNGSSHRNLTANYLNIVLKSVTGKNASSHIFDFITNEARYLLIHTKLSLKEVASQLGFADQSYFTRFFKKQTGMNPLDWFNRTI